MTKLSLGKLKEKLNTHMDNLIEDLLILVSNEPKWKRDERKERESTQTRKAPTEDKENNFATVIMVDAENSSQDEQMVPCDMAS